MRTVIPENEAKRLEAVFHHGILDTGIEAEFERITELAMILTDTPISLISILDEKRQWIKSRKGLDIEEIPREISFCQYTILETKIFEVQNARSDPRFCDNPFVLGDPFIQFYAGYPIIDENGYALGTICVIDRDTKTLSESQKKGLKLLAEETMFLIRERLNRKELSKTKDLLEKCNIAANIGTWEVDLIARTLSWSKTTREIHEVNEDFIPDLETAIDFYKPGENRERLRQMFADCVDKHKPYDGEFILITAKGNERWVRTTGSPILKEGKCIRVYGTFQDITPSKLSELQLKESEFKFRTFFELSPVGIALNDLETGKFLDVNPAVYGPAGYSKEEFLNLSYWDLTPKEYESQENDILFALQTIGIYGPYEKEYIRKDGQKYPVLLYGIRTTDFNGKSVIWSVVQDITEQKKIEQELIDAKNKAESASMAKSEFLANMSHEIRTPLNGIIGFIDLLKKTHLDETQIEYVQIISESSKLLLDLINDILDFSKIEAGKMELILEPTDIVSILKESTSILEYKAREKGIQLKLEIPEYKLPNLECDRLRLKQILVNLLSNAVKFIEVGSVRLQLLDKGKKNGNRMLRIHIIDTGIGIPNSKLTHIFQAFCQADSTTTRKFGGTGLGLTISNRLLELMGSKLYVNSEVGKGSDFYFDLFLKEIHENAQVSDTSHSASVADLQGKKILIAEDNTVNLLLIKTYIQKISSNLVIFTATNGLDAIEIARRENPDLILIDIHMPKMNGWEATEQIRSLIAENTIVRNSHLPIIALTAATTDSDIEKCMKSGMDLVLTKPVLLDNLKEAIQRFL